MLKSIDRHVLKQESFVFETTLAGKIYAKKIPQWKTLGYHVSILFLKLSDVNIAISRVAERVIQGGHFIEEDVIRRRFFSGWKNMKDIYMPLSDNWAVYDNSGEQPLLVEWSEQV